MPRLRHPALLMSRADNSLRGGWASASKGASDTWTEVPDFAPGTTAVEALKVVLMIVVAEERPPPPPYLRADLVSALAGLDVDDFSHGARWLPGSVALAASLWRWAVCGGCASTAALLAPGL